MGASSTQEHPRPRLANDCDPACIVVFLLFSVWFVMMCLSYRDPPHYSIAIAAASGLDRNATAAALDPVFNVTVRVASRSKDQACLHPATSVQDSYLRVPLAGGRVRPADGLCAPPWKSADLAVVARGKAVPVPGFLLDSLAEDMRTGEAVFEVTLMSPNGGHWDVRTCWGKIGDAAALDDSCHTSWVDADSPVPQPAGRVQGVINNKSDSRRPI